MHVLFDILSLFPRDIYIGRMFACGDLTHYVSRDNWKRRSESSSVVPAHALEDVPTPTHTNIL